jgi:hypothetical protein
LKELETILTEKEKIISQKKEELKTLELTKKEELKKLELTIIQLKERNTKLEELVKRRIGPR